MKKLIKTDINNFYKDLGSSKEEKKVNEEIKKLKKQVAISCIYFFIDVKKEYVANGFLYIGQTNSIKNRILNYKNKNSELYIKLLKRLGLYSPYPELYEDEDGYVVERETNVNTEILEFINDPERCKLIIKKRRKAETDEQRKKIEKRLKGKEVKKVKHITNTEQIELMLNNRLNRFLCWKKVVM